jgi:DNA-binding response OmpR family regulator
MAKQDDGATTRDGPGSVVILCADETVRAAIAYWATLLPVRIVVAEDGYQANRILRGEDCRLLVTDRILPPWPGLDTFHQLRERNPRLRIAFVEGTSREDVGLARVAGASIMLPRPLRRQVVADTISEATRTS